ncbi:MAG: hypothetical protein LLF75_10560 [Eubacteriales bacterium]|nr:hypothetical protein [Eubacteriales bacterium]
MNRYEALGAPPTLSSKDLAMHIKMLPSAALLPELRTQYSGDLLKPKVRLYDELTTLRFPARPGPEERSALYISACAKLAHASGEPIPYRFFKKEFLQLLEDCGCTEQSSPNELNETMLSNAVGSLKDAWQIQAYAALTLRIAENSELSDPKNAHRAWYTALSTYQRFFTEAKVEDSCAYQAQTEERFRQDCRDEWNGFLSELIDGVYQRLKRYIQQNKADSVSACMQILQLNLVKKINPEICAKAMQDSLLPYTKSIRSAATLGIAGEMFRNCPKELLALDESGECKRAMLGALKNAVELLDLSKDKFGQFDFGDKKVDPFASKEEKAEQEKKAEQIALNKKNVDQIMEWANTLGVVDLYENGSILVKKDANDFLEACAKFIRDVVQDNLFGQTRAMELLVTLFPADFVIARAGGEKELKQADMLGYGVLNYIGETVPKGSLSWTSETEARQLGKNMYSFINDNIPKGKFRNQTLGEVNQFLVVRLQESGLEGAGFQAYLEPFPDDWPILDPNFKSFQVLRERLFGSPLVKRALALLTAARDADTGSSEEEKCLRELIGFACLHPGLDLKQKGTDFTELMDHTLVQAFVGNFNRYSDNHYDSQAEDTIQLCGSFLPKGTELPTGSKKKLTTDMILAVTSIEKDNLVVQQRANYDLECKTNHSGSTPPALPNHQVPPSPYRPPVVKPKKTRKFTKLNGIRFRGGNAAAGIQYYLWMIVLPALGVFGVDTLMVRGQVSPNLYSLVATAFICLWAVLLINGIFGLMANSNSARASGFGKAMRVFIWMAAVLVVLLVASVDLWPENRFLRVLLAAWAFILLSVTFQQIDKHAYYRTSTMTIDAITLHGGGIAVFFKFIVIQMFIPCFVASLVYIFGWHLSPGWVFAFKLYALLLLIGILRTFFTCLAEESGVKRFATFMATEIYLLTLPAAGWYSIRYFNAFPLKWWVIVLYVVYGIIFLIGTIAATQIKE